MHKIAQELSDHECYFTPYYADGLINLLAKGGMLNNTILGGRHHRNTMKYLRENNLPLDIRGKKDHYDLVLTGSDAIIQKNIHKTRIILIQEGMTEPEGIPYHLVKALKLPRWLANTSVTGLSNAFDAFCVASQGYRDLFIHKGVHPEKIVITGIPNFDNLGEIEKSDFPYEDFVLVATTPFRETMRPEIRPLFIRRCVDIANGRQLIFKLHPLENAYRAIREINRYAPGAKIYWRGDINKMMAKAQTVITQWSKLHLRCSGAWEGSLLRSKSFGFEAIDANPERRHLGAKDRTGLPPNREHTHAPDRTKKAEFAIPQYLGQSGHLEKAFFSYFLLSSR